MIIKYTQAHKYTFAWS